MTIDNFQRFLFLMGFIDESTKKSTSTCSTPGIQYSIYLQGVDKPIRVFINDAIDRMTQEPNESRVNIFWGEERTMESFTEVNIPQAQERIMEILGHDQTRGT